jgi:predicted metal-binding protein
VFNPLTQLACQNCGQYGRSYVCPPFVRKYNLTKEYLQKFNNFYYVVSESDPLEYEKRYNEMKTKCGNLGEYRLQNLVGTQINAMNCGNVRHDLKIIVKFIESKYKKFNFFEIGGGCNRCRPCRKWLHQPCAHPKEAKPSPEGSGIDNYNTLKNVGYTIETPPIKKYISVAMVFWKE